jgi:hypothetical protein
MNRLLVAAFALLVAAVFVAPASAGSCTARVVHGSGAIRAKQQPCTFTVPAGKTAVNLKCHRADPATNWSHNGPCKVYSVTQKREMVDGNGNPLGSLPPGKYRFNVGGRPGAYGTFSFKLK